MSKVILVNSHRRSGTHFLIDSLRANIPKTYFPGNFFLPADFNIGLLHAKSDRIYNIFKREIKSDGILIVKSHLLPEEMNLQNPRDKHEQLIKDIFTLAKKIYIKREGKDVLVSLYHLLSPEINFSEFLRSPNEHISRKIREVKAYDKNRVIYWAYHIGAWEECEQISVLEFNDLKNNFDITIHEISDFLGVAILSDIHKPEIPKHKWLHAIQKKMSSYGLIPIPESSSVRPGKGRVGGSHNYFNTEDKAYFNTQMQRARFLHGAKD